jgi:hypothetical protein
MRMKVRIRVKAGLRWLGSSSEARAQISELARLG